MTLLQPKLAEQLAKLHVDVDEIDYPSTIKLENVPLEPGLYSKDRTNLLIKKLGTVYTAWVDQDLAYAGPDPFHQKLFTEKAQVRSGWRLLSVGPHGMVSLEAAIERAMLALGVRTLPELITEHAPPQNGLLARFGRDLARVAERGINCTIGRDDLVLDLLNAVLLQNWPVMPVIVGPAGAGKSALLETAAGRLKRLSPSQSVFSLDLGVLFAESGIDTGRDRLLCTVLEEAAAAHIVLALENIDLALASDGYGPYLLRHALKQGLPVIGVMTDTGIECLEAPVLRRYILAIVLEELPHEETVIAVTEAIQRLAHQYQIVVDDACVHVAITASRDLDGLYPGKALRVLEMAICRNARLDNNKVVGPDDILRTASLLQHSTLASR